MPRHQETFKAECAAGLRTLGEVAVRIDRMIRERDRLLDQSSAIAGNGGVKAHEDECAIIETKAHTLAADSREADRILSLMHRRLHACTLTEFHPEAEALIQEIRRQIERLPVRPAHNEHDWQTLRAPLPPSADL